MFSYSDFAVTGSGRNFYGLRMRGENVIYKEDILKQLETFQIEKGKPVLVHTSLKAIGEIDGGADTLLTALISYFTKDGGLLCIPTHTWTNTVMDRRNAETCVGVLSNVAAAHPDGIRSMHPTHSIVVFGDREKALEFVREEAYVNTPTSPDGCYGKFYKEDGYILLIGVSHNKNTFLHCVEEKLQVPNRLTKEMVERTIIHEDGSIGKRHLYWFDESEIPDVSANFGKFEPAFRYHNCIVDGFIGNAKTQLCSATRMQEVMELIHSRNTGEELLADNKPLDEKLYLL